MTQHPIRRALLALPVALLALAACGGGDDSAETTTTTAAPTTTVAPTTTRATTTTSTTVVTTTTEPATTTTAAPAPTWPLTGLPLEDPNDPVALRRAAVVKIENSPAAVPQSGLLQADIVYEENVEGVTRFAAVFHSQTPDPVGPVRSGRTQDINLLESLNHPLFLWSGGNANVTKAINASELVPFNETKSKPLGISFRISSRKAPHNLYGHLDQLWLNAPPEPSAPTAIFSYGFPGAVPAGDPNTGIDLKMEGGLTVKWDYDPASGRYLRSQRGKPHKDNDGAQISARNVVVLALDYQPSPADAHSPEAQTVGTGEAWVLRDGVVTHGTWSRADEHAAWTLTDAAGAPILLDPGNTWVELGNGAETVQALR